MTSVMDMTEEGPIDIVVLKATFRKVLASAAGSRRSETRRVFCLWGRASENFCSPLPFSMLSDDGGVDSRDSGERKGLKISLKRRDVQCTIARKPMVAPRNHQSSLTYSACRAALSLISSSVGEEPRAKKVDGVEEGILLACKYL